MKLSRWRRAWAAFATLGGVGISWCCAQDAADWAADGRWYWPLAVGGAIGWLFWAYEDAARAITGRRSA